MSQGRRNADFVGDIVTFVCSVLLVVGIFLFIAGFMLGLFIGGKP